jgi:hypothetical protein
MDPVEFCGTMGPRAAEIDKKCMRAKYIENIKKIAKESIDNIMNAVTVAIENL